MTRARANHWANVLALLGALLVFPTGLVLLARFHIGPEGAQRLASLGLSRVAWLHLHQAAAVAMAAAVAVHVRLYWRAMVTRVRRARSRLPGGAARSDLALYFGSALVAPAAFAAWLLLPEPLHHPAIDLHNLSGLILLPAVVLHVRRHFRSLFPRRRTVMEVNNAIYETHGHLWWSEDAGFELTSLRFCMNPVRYAYFQRILGELAIGGRAVLDIGCGGGYLSEAFAKDGFQVTGLDPAANSIRAARRHAEESGLPIRYEIGRGESLPFPDAAFDIVCCCDALEHVDDAGQVLRETARTLKPGGVFFYDTVNRTLSSKLVLIKAWQDWNLGGFAAPNAHVWEKFLRPAELMELLRAAGLTPGGVRGVTAAKSPAALLYGLWKIRTARIRGAAVADAFALREGDDLSVSYMGWARRP